MSCDSPSAKSLGKTLDGSVCRLM